MSGKTLGGVYISWTRVTISRRSMNVPGQKGHSLCQHNLWVMLTYIINNLIYRSTQNEVYVTKVIAISLYVYMLKFLMTIGETIYLRTFLSNSV